MFSTYFFMLVYAFKKAFYLRVYLFKVIKIGIVCAVFYYMKGISCFFMPCIAVLFYLACLVVLAKKNKDGAFDCKVAVFRQKARKAYAHQMTKLLFAVRSKCVKHIFICVLRACT